MRSFFRRLGRHRRRLIAGFGAFQVCDLVIDQAHFGLDAQQFLTEHAAIVGVGQRPQRDPFGVGYALDDWLRRAICMLHLPCVDRIVRALPEIA